MKLEEYLLVEARIARERANLANLKRELADYGLYPGITAQTVGGLVPGLRPPVVSSATAFRLPWRKIRIVL